LIPNVSYVPNYQLPKPKFYMEQQGTGVGIQKSATIAAHSIATALRIIQQKLMRSQSNHQQHILQCYILLYLYKEAGDKPLHAMSAELWLGQKPVCRLEPIHCFGLTAGKIRAYTDQVLQAFARQYGVSLYQYKDMFEITSNYCPVRPCPLHPES
jgi:hypothetical protein